MMRDWWSLYQQSPRNPEGSLFRIGQIPALEAVPVGGRDVRAWDLAATAQGGDYTVGVRMRKTDEGRFIVVDVVRIQGAPEAVEAAIVNTASQDGRGVLVSIPQDPGAAGVSVVEYLTRKLAGYRVTSSRETGDKATRAGPFAAQVNVGNVSIAKAAWNTVFLAELRDFPATKHDDQVDAASRAFNELTTIPRPPEFTNIRRNRG